MIILRNDILRDKVATHARYGITTINISTTTADKCDAHYADVRLFLFNLRAVRQCCSAMYI